MNTKSKPTPNKIDQRMFDCIKILLASGQTAAQIEEYLGVAPCTTYRIKQCENLQEYKNMMAAMSAKRTAKRAKAKEADLATEMHGPVIAQPVLSAVTDSGKATPVQQVVEHRQSVTVQTSYYVTQKLDTMIDLLKTISAKLAFIVDELIGVKPGKKEEQA